MSHRTQIVLTDEQYRLLEREAARTGASLGALVRTAVDARFGRSETAESSGLEALEQSAGVWSDLDVDGATYVDRLRTGRRLSIDSPTDAPTAAP